MKGGNVGEAGEGGEVAAAILHFFIHSFLYNF